MTETTPNPLGNVITIDDERIKSHLDRVVRGSVEETLNALLDAEADRLCNAQRYERSEARRDTRAGHYERKLQTKAGEVKLRIPKLRTQTFETAIIERYRRRESSVEEALIEMYLAGVSGRGNHRCAVGHARVAIDGIGPEQEDLRNDRDVAQPADRRRAP
jgi:putative transposase